MPIQNLSQLAQKYRQGFGGSLLKGSNAKEKRPYCANAALHIVLCSQKACGARSMLSHTHRYAVKRILLTQAKRFQTRIYSFANSGNHLHLLVKPPRSRAEFTGFLRSISGLIVRQVARTQRGRPLGGTFWDARPFTRIVSWGLPFKRVTKYLARNALEAVGFVAVQKLHPSYLGPKGV